jgi:uncharacterized membrane-anchored protein
MRLSTLALGVLIAAVASTTRAGTVSGQAGALEEFEAKLGYQTGTITLRDGLATLDLPPTFRFLGPDGSKRLLEQAWGNPPGSADGVLGMLVPSGVSPLSDSGWAVVITYDEDGYVDDKGAESIDYGKLLLEMQEGIRKENKARIKKGYEPVTLLGWAEPPSYNPFTHKLYWAKELQFGNAPEHTLNYNVRVLGRRGVLVLNAVAAMPQLPTIRTSMNTVIAFVAFGEGHRYSDYVPGSDQLATYGIAALVAGTVAAKTGFFKVLLTALLAAKKMLVVILLAVGTFLRRLWARFRGEDPPPPAV